MKCLNCSTILWADRKRSELSVNGKIELVVNDRQTREGDHYVCPRCGKIGRFNVQMNLRPLTEDEITNLIIKYPVAATKLIEVKESVIRKNGKK